ncbi:FixH family protein [Actinoplanes sp. DH11]|uniref:FixH family protein n=1 Tax=Actinoplanes sp. DH11 TaxID=2857011 RepID=UPI001E634602|nr:FixH family protein [Actinoplanes sp. DH11]
MSALKEKWRLPDDIRHGKPARVTKPARASRPAGGRKQARPRSRPFRQGLILGVCIGMTAALLVGVAAFLLTPPRAATPAVAEQETATDKGRAAEPQAAISIVSEHLGDLQVRIEARVSSPGSYDPITKGQVVAYTDMVAMPKAHKQGPIVMAEISGKPGVYEAMTNVPMAGEYNVVVEVKQPMASTANQRLEVGTVPAK